MRTLVVIPSRYEPERLRRLVFEITDDVLVLDNGHTERPPVAGARVLDARGQGIYEMWNRGVDYARRKGYDAVVMLNDDAEVDQATLSRMEDALERRDVGIAYPGTTTVSDPLGPYIMTGWCFAFRVDLPVPPFDEGFEWWCGDTAFERNVLQAGYLVVGVPGNAHHVSDAERDGWARRPELLAASIRDLARWEAMLA